MRMLSSLSRFFAGMTPRAVRLLAIGLLPIFLSLAFLALASAAPEGARFGTAWLSRYFAFWVDQVGVSILLLIAGVLLLNHAEKRDSEQKK